MSSIIQVLPSTLADKIAAGEVVERPASVVKELVENAMDAGAKRIAVDFRVSGGPYIAITDDGLGMGRDDALLAIRRHATSKIKDEDDLFQIQSLGFRGEALPSIASVSRLRIETRRQQDLAGTMVEVEGGMVTAVEEMGCPVGTRVQVKDLFFNTPARRKFLKTDATEAGHIGHLMSNMGLARMDLHLVVVKDGRPMADLPPASSLEERAVAVLGQDSAKELYPFQGEEGAIQAHGLLSSPSLTLTSTRGLYLFVNGRSVRERLLSGAIQGAYRGALDARRHPLVILHLTLPPDRVDVNVHPQKFEVRFREADRVRSVIVRAMLSTIRAAPWLKGAVKIYDMASELPQETPPEPPQGPPRPAPEPPAELPLDPAPWSPGQPNPHFARLREAMLRFGAEGQATPAVEPPPPAPEVGFFTNLRLVGHIMQTYLVCEDLSGLVLVDQHAAYERLAFETLKEALDGRPGPSQALLIPVEVDVGFGQAWFAENHEDLDRLGLALEVRDGLVVVQRVPVILGKGDIRRLVMDLVEISSEGRALSEVAHKALASMACHSSPRGGDPLSERDIQHLFHALDRIKHPGTCPHGRPIAVRIDRAEIARRFGRT